MGNSLEQALKRCDFGGACAPPFCAVGCLSPRRVVGKGCLSGVGGVKVLGGANLSAVRWTKSYRTNNQCIVVLYNQAFWDFYRI